MFSTQAACVLRALKAQGILGGVPLAQYFSNPGTCCRVAPLKPKPLQKSRVTPTT